MTRRRRALIALLVGLPIGALGAAAGAISGGIPGLILATLGTALAFICAAWAVLVTNQPREDEQ
jgi:hypothetical protein